ncbi:MAG: UvrD-helicase domain-containing protein [Pseudomonadota bacterium]|nr:UvrD-helicase domain-containing protein [Pseudomonadota bacterium]
MTRESAAPPDQADRDRALQVNESFIVQAPAGSGKTSLLVERYLRLLAQVAQPEEILAITFTRAAAAEMKQRVLLELQKDTSLTEAIRDKDRSLNWHLSQNPQRMKIQTIDSFATEIATQVPGSQSAEGMRIEEQPDPLYLQAAQNTLGRLFFDDPSGLLVAEFLAALDNNASTAERVLSAMLGKRDQWLDVTGLITSLALSDDSAIKQTMTRAVCDLRREILSTVSAALMPSDHEMIHTLARETGNQASLEALLPLILTKAGSIRKTVDRRQSEAFTDSALKGQTVDWLEKLSERKLESLLQTCAMLPEIDEDTDVVVATGVTLALAASELERLLRKRHTIDFTGMLMRASQGLRDEKGPTELAIYWDYKIKHLLVDEFQDTSRSQYRFFCLLTEGWSAEEGNTFFAVGDPMQSIYRFRDADVSIFSQCWEDGLPNVDLQPIQLRANFRSSRGLVDWNNDLFGRLFPQSALPKLGAIPFSPAVTQKTDSDAMSNATAVQLHGFTNEQLEAQAIANHVSALLKQHHAEENYRIGILCRARTHLPNILRALQSANIAYTSTDIDALSESPVVTDLMSLHTLLLRPAEHLAWYAILRSPMIGLSLTDLEHFADAPDREAYTLQQAEVDPAVERFADALSWARPRLYELPITEVIEGCWMRLGGVDAYPQSSLPQAQRWFDLLESMGESALDPDAVQAKTENLYAQDMSQSPVKVMTIHKSKGLEFTDVILPNLGRRSRSEETDIMLWRPNNDDLLIGIKNDSVHNWLAFEEKNRRENETKRLLYVACTRAKSSLWLSTASHSQRPQGLAKYLPPMAGEQSSSEKDAEKQPLVLPAMQGHLAQLPPSYQWNPGTLSNNNYLDETTVEHDIEADEGGRTIAVEAASELDIDDRQNRFSLSVGNLVHQALAHIALGYCNGRVYNLDAVTTYLEQQLPKLDAYPDQWQRVTEVALLHIDRTLKNPAGQWLLEAHVHGQVEWPITMAVDGVAKRLVMDRIFFSRDSWWIVDYKTAEPDLNQAVSDFIAQEVSRYRGQLDQYSRALSALLSDQPERFEGSASTTAPIKTALYFTALPRLETLPTRLD